MKRVDAQPEWTSARRLSPEEAEWAKDTIYDLLPQVNENTNRRMKELGLTPPNLLDQDNVYLLTGDQMKQKVAASKQARIHPLLEAVVYYLDPDFDSSTDPMAFTEGETVYFNMEKWLEDGPPSSEKRIIELLKEAIVILEHEDIHHACREVTASRKTSLLLIEIMATEISDLLGPLLKEVPDDPLNQYLSRFFEAAEGQDFVVKICGALVDFLVDGKVIRDWPALDEAFAWYELLHRHYGHRWKKMIDRPSGKFGEGVKDIILAHQKYFSQIRRWENQFGNKRLMRAFYQGQLYDLVL